jgi:nucleotide-binding universal stress UspA family protein
LPLRKVLVAYDGSEQSKRALDHAAEIASAFKGSLIILTVVPRVSIPVFPDEGFGSLPMSAPGEFADYEEKMKIVYGKSQEEALKRIREKYPELKVEGELLEGRPSSTIDEEAERNGVDVIVMGSRGIGGISGWILGSTSRRVAETCTKPVLIVK